MIRLGESMKWGGWRKCAVQVGVVLSLATLYISCSPNPVAAVKFHGESQTLPSLAPQPPASAPGTTMQEVPSVAPVDNPDAETLFRLVLAEQEKYQQKLTKLQFTSHWEVNWLRPGRERKLVHERKVVRDAGNAWCEKLIRNRIDEEGSQSPDQVHYSVWNDDSYIDWFPGSVIAHMWEYDDPAMLPEKQKFMMRAAGAFPERKYAYGTGEHSLSEVGGLESRRYPCRFEAERSANPDGRILYTLRGWMSDRSAYPRPVWILSVDPTQGYMVTNGVNQSAKVALKLRSFTVVPKEISPGIWFPVEWEITEYGDVEPNSGEQAAIKRSTYTMTDVTLNPPGDSSRFTWKSIQLPAETRFLRQDKSGELELMKQENGELIPVDIKG